MDVYHDNERVADDNCSIDLGYENGIKNLMDMENHNENHQQAQEPDYYGTRNCDYDFFD